MGGFVAADKVEPLAYDFTTAPGYTPEWPGAGVVPEPTAEALAAFLEGVNDYRKAITASADDPTAAAQFAGTAAFDKVRQLVTAVTGGDPSAEQIAALPPRYLSAFAAWLLRELGGTDPKG
jgi:hypothetical protein